MLDNLTHTLTVGARSYVLPLVAAGYLVAGAAPAHAHEDASRLDLLFVIDNSGSMGDEQAALSAEFPRMIRMLTSGQKSSGESFPAFRDIHLGVVSADMGVAGVANNYPGCNTQRHVNGGDDGILQHAGGPPPCQPSYPAFLSYIEGTTDPEGLGRDLACIAQLGTAGCGFEQPLEAALKALWPKTYVDADGNAFPPERNPILFLATTAENRYGHGDTPVDQGGNGGFSRSDREAGSSVLAIILMTDEDDCSSRDTSHFMPTNDPTNPLSSQPVNLRCLYNPDNLFDLQRYARGYEELRPGEPHKVLFATIAGVPTDLIDRDIDFADDATRDAYYDQMLGDARMQQVVDDNPIPQLQNLQPSCSRTEPSGEIASAYPPRRIVEVAKELGSRGHVESICQDFDVVAGGLVDFLSTASAF